VTKTITDRLREACRARGFKSTGGPDEPVSAPEAMKWWACVYDPNTGHVAVLVTGARSAPKRVRRQLLDGIDQPAPVVRTSRAGTVVMSSSSRPQRGVWEDNRVLVEFDGGARELFPHPLMVSIRPGMPVKEVEFNGHEGSLILWGPEYVPRRLTRHRVKRKRIASP
jgi:hypothetical protein